MVTPSFEGGQSDPLPPSTFDTIHPIGLKVGAYNKLHLYFQLSETTWCLIGLPATITKWKTSQVTAILDFHIFRFCSNFHFSTWDWNPRNRSNQESITRSVYLTHDYVLGLWVNHFAWINWIPRDWMYSMCLIRKISAFFSCAGNWKSKNKYGGGRFVADDIHFHFSQWLWL